MHKFDIQIPKIIKMKNIILAGWFLFSLSFVKAQEVPTADVIMKAAYAKAAKENKKVFVKFSASWCGWCHKMDASLKDPLVEKYFNNNYIFVVLIVDESDKNKNLENPGAAEFRKILNGDGVGIPFWAVLDAKENILADSYIRTTEQTAADKGSNIGCPAQEDEVQAFIKVLKKTTKITAEQEKNVYDVFRKNDSKYKAS